MLHTCDGAGWLVDPMTPMLADPTDWSWPGREPVPHGCDRLKCFICGAVVKQKPGWLANTAAMGSGTEWRDRCAALHAAEDWSAFPYVRPVAKWRLYVCRCSILNNDATRPIVDPHGDDMFGKPPAAPYRCAGHPVPTLPFRHHGIEVDADTDLWPTVRRILAGDVPASAVAEELTATNLIVNLRRRVEDTPGAAMVDAAAIRGLEEEDPAVAMGAIAYVWNVATAPLAQALADATSRHLPRWIGTPDPRPTLGPSLGARALSALGKLTPRFVSADRVLPWMRDALSNPGLVRAALPTLKLVDRDWLRGHLDEAIRAQVGHEEDLIFDLDPTLRPVADYIRQMLAAGCQPRAIRAAIDKYMWGDDKRAALAALESASSAS